MMHESVIQSDCKKPIMSPNWRLRCHSGLLLGCRKRWSLEQKHGVLFQLAHVNHIHQPNCWPFEKLLHVHWSPTKQEVPAWIGLMSQMNSVTHRVQRKDIWDQFTQTALPQSQDQSLKNDGVSTAHQTTDIIHRYKTKLHFWSFLMNPHEALPLNLDCSDVYLLRCFRKKKRLFFFLSYT